MRYAHVLSEVDGISVFDRHWPDEFRDFNFELLIYAHPSDTRLFCVVIMDLWTCLPRFVWNIWTVWRQKPSVGLAWRVVLLFRDEEVDEVRNMPHKTFNQSPALVLVIQDMSSNV